MGDFQRAVVCDDPLRFYLSIKFNGLSKLVVGKFFIGPPQTFTLSIFSVDGESPPHEKDFHSADTMNAEVTETMGRQVIEVVVVAGNILMSGRIKFRSDLSVMLRKTQIADLNRMLGLTTQRDVLIDAAVNVADEAEFDHKCLAVSFTLNDILAIVAVRSGIVGDCVMKSQHSFRLTVLLGQRHLEIEGGRLSDAGRSQPSGQNGVLYR